MPNDCISYQESGYFSKLITDYLDQKPELSALYNRFPSPENFREQLVEKSENYDTANRHLLVFELEKQYDGLPLSPQVKANIDLLKHDSTFTITTGHQLNLFTGPLYFLYKIVSTINLCKSLKKTYPAYDFVPVYWMASEDHDFEEINHFNYHGEKISWDRPASGPVGRLDNQGLEVVLQTWEKQLGQGENANTIKQWFRDAYLEHQDLATATRYLAHEIFKAEGLVIIDGDSHELKKRFVPYAKKELLERSSFEQVNHTNTLLQQYKIQVNPREINLFYIKDGLRERLLFEAGMYQVNHTDITFDQDALLEELTTYPERFSPNVILRPLYQEILLPNLAYIGGGGELAYWLQLYSNFKANQVTFPMLVLRNSVLLASQKQAQKADRLHLSWKDLFQNREQLLRQQVLLQSGLNLDFTPQKEALKKQFEALWDMARQTDPSFSGAVKAQEAKQLKGLENLEKRLLKAEKKRHTELLARITELQESLFPKQGLQERQQNFSVFYEAYGPDLLAVLLQQLDPLSQEFTIITL